MLNAVKAKDVDKIQLHAAHTQGVQNKYMLIKEHTRCC